MKEEPTDNEETIPTEEVPADTSAAEETAPPEDTSKEGVKLPEAFQQSVHDLVSQCTNNAQVDYVMSCINDKRTELSKSTEEKPAEFNESDMPA